MKNKDLKKQLYFLASVLIFLCAVSVSAQTTEFTYQGKLSDSGTPTATYDFEFRLCNSLAADCSAPLAVQQISGVPVTNGIFTVRLDFGAGAFNGANRWLEIAVKRPAQTTFTTLTPRQPLTSAPYAIRSLNAANSDNAALFGGFAPDGFVRNTTMQQTGDFNLSGDGTLGGILLANRVGVNVASLQAGINLDVSGNSVFRTANGNINLGTPNGETGMTFTNANRADIRFDGTSLRLLAGTGANIPAASNGITINRDGNVGIGVTQAPSARLDVVAGLFGSLQGIAVSGVTFRNNGIGVYGSVGGLANASAGVFDGRVVVNGLLAAQDITAQGKLSVRTLGTTGGFPLCLNGSDIISYCSSSLRYKKDLQNFSGGLSFINQLRPIAYKWKTDNIADVGFGAEDVARINPLFVTYNSKGEVEGIKYDRLSVLFVNAFKEQQTQIQQQDEQIKGQKTLLEAQQKQIDELKKIVCGLQPQADICR